MTANSCINNPTCAGKMLIFQLHNLIIPLILDGWIFWLDIVCKKNFNKNYFAGGFLHTVQYFDLFDQDTVLAKQMEIFYNALETSSKIVFVKFFLHKIPSQPCTYLFRHHKKMFKIQINRMGALETT